MATWHNRPLKVLTPAEIDQFVTDGYVILRDAFAEDDAAAVSSIAYGKLGIDPSASGPWPKPTAHLAECLTGPEVDRIHTDRLMGAFDDLLGEGQWIHRSQTGWFPVLFPGHHEPPWRPPEKGWHVDGNYFHHHLDTPEMALLVILVFSHIEPGGGGTAFRVGSHKTTARALHAAIPDGLSASDVSKPSNAVEWPPESILELNGRPGDVALLHPFMSHGASMNTGSRLRMISNKGATLKEPMQFDRENPDDHSPLEWSIVEALKNDE